MTDDPCAMCLCDILLLCHCVPPDDNDDEAGAECNMAAVSPIPKIVTTPIKEDFSREEEDVRDECGKSEKNRYHTQLDNGFLS